MDKDTLILERKNFFEEILEQVKRPPARIDDILHQSQFYMPIDDNETFYDEKAGDLAICISGKFYNKQFKVYYSFWQLGNMLKIGVAIYDEDLQTAFESDAHHEIDYIWGMKNTPRVDVSHECIYYDWEFDVENLYQSYRDQEKYILGARHMHFRVMRILNDECYRIYVSNNIKEDPFTNINFND